MGVSRSAITLVHVFALAVDVPGHLGEPVVMLKYLQIIEGGEGVKNKAVKKLKYEFFMGCLLARLVAIDSGERGAALDGQQQE